MDILKVAKQNSIDKKRETIVYTDGKGNYYFTDNSELKMGYFIVAIFDKNGCMR